VNLPIQDILKITSFWLRENSDLTVTKQTLKLFKVILNRNYFQYDGKFFKSIRSIAMGSPLSGVVAELYLKYFEKYELGIGWKMEKFCIIEDT
jgi:hypothetical protein